MPDRAARLVQTVRGLAPSRGGRLGAEWIAAGVVTVACLRVFLTEDFLARPPLADRGTFILCSKLMAEGRVLYRDVWDNKPPMIHLLGAAAWWISPHVRAVFEMERGALLLLAGTLFAMLRYALGFRLAPALGGLVIGLVTLRNPEVFNGGHLTEEYGILFETAAVACLALARRSPRARRADAWAGAAGVCAALTLLTRQTFVVSLAAIWLAVHAPLVREPRRLARLVAYELAGFALPSIAWTAYLWRTGSARAFLELVPEVLAFGAAPPYRPPVSAAVARDLNWPRAWPIGVVSSPGSVSTRITLTVRWMVALVFHGDVAVAAATGIIVAVALVVGAGARRRVPSLGMSAALTPLWFVAELVAASTPGEYSGAYYLAFVPIWACLTALVLELLLPRAPSRGAVALARGAAGVALVALSIATLDASYRTDPRKYWWVFAREPRLPPALVERLQTDAARFGWRRYVPLVANSPEVSLDMPLHQGTRFLAQLPHQFPDADSPRARELLADVAAADVVIEDRRRLPLGQEVERRIMTILRTSFTPLFDWATFHFYARRNAPERNPDAAG